jgi:hypothetical protein
LILLINVYNLSSTKLEIRAKQFLLGSEGIGRERKRARGKGGAGDKGDRNDPDIVCAYE